MAAQAEAAAAQAAGVRRAWHAEEEALQALVVEAHSEEALARFARQLIAANARLRRQLAEADGWALEQAAAARREAQKGADLEAMRLQDLREVQRLRRAKGIQ